MTIADHAERVMQERGINIVMWGDGTLADIYSSAFPNKRRHPLDAMKLVLASLRKSSKFEAVTIRGHDSRGYSRIVSGFRLISQNMID